MNMHQKNSCSSQLFQVMQKQTELITDYLEYLDKIKQAISQSDPEALNNLLTVNKLDTEHIENAQNQQTELLIQYGFESTENGLSHCIKECQQAELTQMHQTLTAHLKELEKSLLINELLIRKNQDRIRQSIRILSGHGVSQNSGTYSREGNKDNNEDNKRSIALA